MCSLHYPFHKNMIEFFAATTEKSIYKVNRGYQDGSAEKLAHTQMHTHAMAHVHTHRHHTQAIIDILSTQTC